MQSQISATFESESFKEFLRRLRLTESFVNTISFSAMIRIHFDARNGKDTVRVGDGMFYRFLIWWVNYPSLFVQKFCRNLSLSHYLQMDKCLILLFERWRTTRNPWCMGDFFVYSQCLLLPSDGCRIISPDTLCLCIAVILGATAMLFYKINPSYSFCSVSPY
jgi:hypothetical protein